MRKIIFLLIFILNIFFSYTFANNVSGTMNFSVTPIKQRIELDPGRTIVKTAKITNRGNDTVTMQISVSDLTADNITGSPRLLTRKSEEVYEQTLAKRITLQTNTVTLAPKEEKEVTFFINVPKNATPGGHYGAIIFQDNNSSNTSLGNSARVRVHYGSVIILNVSGKIIFDGTVGDTKIDISKNGLGNAKGIDDCPLGDFTSSNYDNKCVDIKIIDKVINPKTPEKLKKKLEEIKEKKQNADKEVKKQEEKTGKKIDLETFKKDLEKQEEQIKKELDNISKAINDKTKKEGNKDKKQENKFGVKFQIPIENKGNTHIHPEGKIVIKDENGKIIKNIGTQVIVNSKGVITDTKIVDYLPLNNQDGDVFPQKTRIFNVEWLGFPREYYNNAGEKKYNYFSPAEAFSTKLNNRKLFPWERKCSKYIEKDLTAYIDVYYTDRSGKKIKTKQEKKFKIAYIKEYVGYNYYILLCAGIILFILWLLFILLLLNKRKCINRDCKKKLKKDMDICPYCGTIQEGENRGKKAKFKIKK